MRTCGERDPERGCGAEVLFVRSAKDPNKRMILNAKPTKGVIVTELGLSSPSGAAVFALTEPTRPYAVARVVDVYTDHHATCPKAGEWKR